MKDKKSQLKQELYAEEFLALLKELSEKLDKLPKKIVIPPAKETVVNVEEKKIEFPKSSLVKVINVETISRPIKDALDRLSEAQKRAQTATNSVKVVNIEDFKQKEISIKNWQKVVDLLDKISKKNPQLKVIKEEKEIKFELPVRGKPNEYIPVRLTDGEQFYNALSSLVSAVKGNDTRFHFTDAGELKVSIVGDVTITGDVIVDDVGLENVAGAKINPATEEKQDDIITNTDNLIKESNTPTIYTIAMTLANTEYSQELPANTRKFTFQLRGAYDTRWSFTAGKVAGLTEPFMTLKAGQNHYEDNLNLESKTLYIACDTAGQTLEIVAWS